MALERGWVEPSLNLLRDSRNGTLWLEHWVWEQTNANYPFNAQFSNDIIISMITKVIVENCKLWLVQDHVWCPAFHLRMNSGVAFRF